MSKLDKILGYISYDGNYEPDGIPEAKEDIKALLLELIGEPSRIVDVADEGDTAWTSGYNSMAEATRIMILELRSRVEEL